MKWVKELVCRGVLSLPEAELSKEFWERPLPEDPGDGVLKALLEEREEAR